MAVPNQAGFLLELPGPVDMRHSDGMMSSRSVRNSWSTGPLVCPPASPSLQNTETAKSPWMALIQVWAGVSPSSTNWAVPVLACTGAPGTSSKAGTVPYSTGPSMRSPNVLASSSVSGVSPGRFSFSVGSTDGSLTNTGDTVTPAATDAATVAMPSGEA